MNIDKLETERLFLIPFTKQLCQLVEEKNFEGLKYKGLISGNGYPDQETLETIPKIKANLELVKSPTGFESWLIIIKSEMKIIGDIGFKGVPNQYGEVDLGYGIIESERKKGYAFEAAQELSNWALSQSKVKKITAKCLINNYGSAKILEKLNFKISSQDNTMQYWLLEDLYSRLKNL